MVDAFSHRNNVLFYYTIISLNSNKNFRKTLYFFRNIPERNIACCLRKSKLIHRINYWYATQQEKLCLTNFTRYATQKSGTRIFPDSDTTRF